MVEQGLKDWNKQFSYVLGRNYAIIDVFLLARVVFLKWFIY